MPNGQPGSRRHDRLWHSTAMATLIKYVRLVEGKAAVPSRCRDFSVLPTTDKCRIEIPPRSTAVAEVCYPFGPKHGRHRAVKRRTDAPHADRVPRGPRSGRQGFVTSLGRPGGNATGLTFFEFPVVGKMLEVLKQIAPGVSRVALASNPDNLSNLPFLRARPPLRPLRPS
jgi:hypothetical protein